MARYDGCGLCNAAEGIERIGHDGAESLVQRCTQDMAIEWVGKSTRARPKIKSCFGLRSRSTTRSRPSFGGHAVRIPAVVSDLRTMPDTPKCSVDGRLNGTNPDFDGFVCWGRRMDRLL